MVTPKKTKMINPAAVVKARRELLFSLIVEKKASKPEIRQALSDAGFRFNEPMLAKDIEVVNRMIHAMIPVQTKEEILAEAIDDFKRLEKLAESQGKAKESADIMKERLKLQGVVVAAPKVIEQNITNNTMNVQQGLSMEQLQGLSPELRKQLLQQSKNTLTLTSAKED